MTRLGPALTSLALMLLEPAEVRAHPWGGRTIGVGVVLGEPTGLTLDVKTSHWSSLELDVGLGTFDDGDFDDDYVHMEFLVRPFWLTHTRSLAIPFYLGVGAFYLEHGRDPDGEDGHLGARFPLGLAFEFRPPVQIFFELGLRLHLVDIDHDDRHDHDLDVGGAIGFRVYF
jgi:hypothetical protein